MCFYARYEIKDGRERARGQTTNIIEERSSDRERILNYGGYVIAAVFSLSASGCEQLCGRASCARARTIIICIIIPEGRMSLIVSIPAAKLRAHE